MSTLTSRGQANLLRHLSSLLRPGGLAALSDRDLLDRFAAGRDEAAFAALVHRHGGLVLGVCRRLLGDAHEAEDVFQATFLVLASKAASLRRREAVAGFLHGVAVRLARKARAQQARLRSPDLRQRAEPSDIPAAVARDELRRVVDEELRRLPAHYRTPLVLCYLEGKSRRQAAAEMGCSEGAVKGKLERGRELLRARLLRRGVALAPLAAGSMESLANAASVPAALTCAAVRVAGSPGTASAAVSALADGMMRTLAAGKLKIMGGVLILCALLGGMGLAVRPAPAEGDPAAAGPLPAGAVARLGQDRFAHEGPVFFVGFARKGQLVTGQQGFTAYCATCHQDLLGDQDHRPLLDSRAFQVWDLEKGRVVRYFGRPEEADDHRTVRAVGLAVGARAPAAVHVALSADGQTMAVAGTDGFVRLWDVTAGREVRSIDFNPRTRCIALAFASDGKQLAVCDTLGMVRLCDVGAGREVRRFRVTDAPRYDDCWGEALVFSPDGNTLAVSAGKYFGLWDATTGKERVPIAGKAVGSPVVAFLPDGKRLLFAGADGTVWLADAGTGTRVRSFGDVAHTAYLAALAVAPDGKTVATRGYDQAVRLWDLEAGRELHLLNPSRLGFPARDGPLFGPTDLSPASSLAFSPDGRFLAAAASSGGARLWEVATGKEDRTGHAGPVIDVAFTAGGRALHSLGADHTVRKWRADTGAQTDRFCLPPGAADAVLSPDGRQAAFSVALGKVELWDVEASRLLHRFDFSPQAAYCVGSIAPDSLAFSPDGKRLAKRTAGGVVYLWEVESGHQRRLVLRQPCGEVPSDHAGGNRSLCFSPDGSRLAVFLPAAEPKKHHVVCVWDVSSGKPACCIDPESAVTTPPAFSPDGRALALGHAGHGISVWELASGGQRCRLTTGAHAALTRLAFAPDGKVVAAADRRTVRFWDLASGKELPSRTGHSLDLVSLAFAPDGRRLVSGSKDTTAVVWDVVGLRPQPGPILLESGELLRQWEALARGPDSAYAAICRLEVVPQMAVRLLRGHLRSAGAPDPTRVARLVADLEAAEFSVRTRATEGLAALGELALPALRKAMASNPPPESRRRLGELIELQMGRTPPERLREMRAVEVLEHCGTPEARALLKELAGGASEASLSWEAAAALRRLGPAGQP
jgi:RNA polymerase sigma factor (sigma-70 family)